MIDCKYIPNAYLDQLEHKSFKYDKVQFDLDCALEVNFNITFGLLIPDFLYVSNTFQMPIFASYSTTSHIRFTECSFTLNMNSRSNLTSPIDHSCMVSYLLITFQMPFLTG